MTLAAGCVGADAIAAAGLSGTLGSRASGTLAAGCVGAALFAAHIAA